MMLCSIPRHQDLYRNKESATDSFGIHCKKLLKKAKIDVGEIAINSIPDVPIWDSEPVTVDFILSEFDKLSTSTVSTRKSFGASHNSLCCYGAIALLTVFEMILYSGFKCIARLCFFILPFLLYNLDFILL